jgi:hypothetical protein
MAARCEGLVDDDQCLEAGTHFQAGFEVVSVEVEGEAFEVDVTVPPGKPRTVEDILSESAVDLKKADAAEALAEMFRPSQSL